MPSAAKRLRPIPARRRFGKSICFLCGCRLGKRNATEEHIFPKWLQARFNLWNEQLTLLNGTTMPYRALRVPCCSTCNNEHLSQIEDKVRSAVERGPRSVNRLDP